MISNPTLSPELFEQIINTISEPTSLVGADYRYVFVNNAYSRFINIPAEKIIGKFVWEVTGKENFETKVKPHFDKALKGENVQYTNHVELLGSTPGMLRLMMNYQPFHIPGTKEKYVLSTAVDITKEEALKDQWKNTVDAIDDVILILNKDLEIENINNAGVRLLGKPLGDILGRKCYQEIHNTPSQIGFCPIIISRETGKKEQVEYYEERLGKWFSLLSSPVFDHNGELMHFVDVMRDITTIKKQEQEIIEREELFKNTFQHAAVGMAHLRPDGKFFRVNKMFCDITGYQEEELLSGDFKNITYPEDLELDLFYIHKVLNNELDSFTIEKRYIHKSGKLLWVELNSSVIRDEKGEILYAIAVITDINDRKTVEAEVRHAKNRAEQSEEKYRAMYQNAPLAYQSLNIEGNIIDINPMWANTLGFDREEVLGKWFGSFLHPDFVDHFRKNFPIFKKRGSISNVQFCMIKKDGSEIYVSFEGCIGYTPEGKFRQTYCTFKDITEEVIAKNELIKAKEKAEESERLKSAFLANMSHEIRTPMNGILGFANLLKDPKLSTEEQEKYITIIEEGGERLLNIINDLISISKIEANQVEVNRSEVNIHEILDYMYSFFSPEAEKKGIKLSLVIPSRKDHIILNSDKEKLFAIFTNLIKNAIKYTDQGAISFGYVLLDGRIRFFVKDSGIGIPEEKRAAVFNRFEQVDQSLNTPYEGAGLGLSIVKAYVEMLGGEIKVNSEFGVGSEFEFYIPLEYKTSDSALFSVTREISSCEHLKSLKVLLVEDDPTSMMLLEAILEGCFKEIKMAFNGSEALTISQENPDIDLILLDLKIPEIDGLEVARRIRKVNNDVKIVAQTAFAFASDEKRALEAGCNDFITKPINKERLMEITLDLFPSTH